MPRSGRGRKPPPSAFGESAARLHLDLTSGHRARRRYVSAALSPPLVGLHSPRAPGVLLPVLPLRTSTRGPRGSQGLSSPGPSASRLCIRERRLGVGSVPPQTLPGFSRWCWDSGVQGGGHPKSPRGHRVRAWLREAWRWSRPSGLWQVPPPVQGT